MAIGCTVADSVADFSFIPPEELNNALRCFTVGGNEASALQRGQMTRLVAEVHRLCPGPRTVDDIISSAAQAAKQAAQAAAAPVTSNAFPSPPDAAPTRAKRKFADTLDQGDDQLFEELAPAEVADLREEHVKVTGGPPAEDCRPTTEQLSALSVRVAGGRAPFTDFAIWGAFGRRTAKLLKYTAQVFVDGSLQTRLLKGPSSFESWRASWRVFRSAMIMLGAARPAALDGYEEGVRRLAVLFPAGWGTIACADETMRAEQWDIVHEQFGSAAPDPDLPWDYVLTQTTYGVPNALRSNWWETRVVLPLLQGQQRGTAAATASHLESVSAAGAGSKPFIQDPPRGGKRNRGNRAGGKPSGGHQPANPIPGPQRDNTKQICYAWNREGTCTDPCPQGRLHICEHCKKPGHRGRDCRSKGQGKGKGQKAPSR